MAQGEVLLYTFRTFPLIAELQAIDRDVFIFSKLKDDLEAIKTRIIAEKPRYVLGAAKVTGLSRIESLAINRFNSGRIMTAGADTLDLCIPRDSPFPTAGEPTHTFCNWTMYQIAYFLKENGHETQLLFIHINSKDMEILEHFVSNLKVCSPNITLGS